MVSDQWPFERIPSEAYSRVTDPDRFAALHIVADQILDGLVRSFQVRRVEGYGLDEELERRSKLARPTVQLLAESHLSAPIVVAFSAFPGLHVRLGRWCLTSFPNCGCDACAESAEGESERLRSLIDDVVAGRFREAVCIPASGDPWVESEFWSDTQPAEAARFPSTRRKFLPCHPDQAQKAPLITVHRPAQSDKRFVDSRSSNQAPALITRTVIDRALAERLIAESGGSWVKWVPWPKSA